MNFTTSYATLVITDYYAVPFGKLLDGEIEELLPVKLHYWGRKLLWVEVFEEDIYFNQFFPIVRITELVKRKIPVYCVEDQVSYTPDPEGGEGVSSVYERWAWSHAPTIPYVQPPLTAWQTLSENARKLTLKNLRWAADNDLGKFEFLLGAALKCGYIPNKKAREYYKRVFSKSTNPKTVEKAETIQKRKEKSSDAKNSKPKGKRPWRETRKENRSFFNK